MKKFKETAMVDRHIRESANNFYKRIINTTLIDFEDFVQEIWVTILDNEDSTTVHNITVATIKTINRLNTDY